MSFTGSKRDFQDLTVYTHLRGGASPDVLLPALIFRQVPSTQRSPKRQHSVNQYVTHPGADIF